MRRFGQRLDWREVFEHRDFVHGPLHTRLGAAAAISDPLGISLARCQNGKHRVWSSDAIHDVGPVGARLWFWDNKLTTRSVSCNLTIQVCDPLCGIRFLLCHVHHRSSRHLWSLSCRHRHPTIWRIRSGYSGENGRSRNSFAIASCMSLSYLHLCLSCPSSSLGD